MEEPDSTDLATGAVKLQRKAQIRPALARAIHHIVDDGLTIPEAARSVGMKEASLRSALKKPHVRAYRASTERAWMASETRRAWLKVSALSGNAASEDVQLKASRLILEAAGELSGRQQDDNQSRTLVQIIAQAVNMTAGDKLLRETGPGVFEAPPYLPPAEGEC